MNFEPNYSSQLLDWLALTGGLVLLTLGGELLVSGAAKLARRLGMSSLLVGLTVVAFGTSMPELFVGIIALLQHHPDILTGNIVGSNIANIGLILGICALLTPLAVRFRSVALELYLVLASTIILFFSAWHGSFPRLLGGFFFLALIYYTMQKFHLAQKSKKRRKKENYQISAADRIHLPASIALTVIGLGCLPLGSNFFIKGAVDIARHFGVSELVIGLTLAAVGTSLPELASCLAAIRQRQTEILVGNIIGSNLFNILMVLGFCALLSPYAMSSSLLVRDIPIMFSFSAVLLPLLAVNHGLSRLHGLIFLVAYFAYLYVLK